MKKLLLVICICFVFVSFRYLTQDVYIGKSYNQEIIESVRDSVFVNTNQKDAEKEKKNVYVVDDEIKQNFDLSTFDFSIIESIEVKEDSITRKKYNAEGNVVFIKTKK